MDRGGGKISRIVAALFTPSKILHFTLSRFGFVKQKLVGTALVYWYSRLSNIKINGGLKIIGFPIIDVCKSGALLIGNGVTLNSRNKGYHINMHSPVKLFIDRPDAKISIGDNTRIHGTCIHAYKDISVGCNCLIAANCQIIDNSGHDLSFPEVQNRINTQGESRSIVIEDCVWVGANTIILPGVTIGYGSIISANSVVHKNIPPMVIAGGNPAKVISNHSAAHA